MAEPEADRRDVDEAQEAFSSLVVAGGDATGILELVEALRDEIVQAIEPAVDGDPQLPSFAHGDDRHHVAHSIVLRMLSAS